MKQRLIKGIICVFALLFFGLAIVASISEAQEIMPDDIYNEDNYTGNTDPDRMPAGWQEIEGKIYYFLPENGEMARGWQEMEGETYYFSIETGEMLSGWQKINGKAYYFDENGILQTFGWIETDSAIYYCEREGFLASGWKKIAGKKYYFLPGSNQMAAGLLKIKGSYYLFHENGQLAQSDSTTLVMAGGEIYCAASDGRAASGWQVRGNRLYFASPKGVVKRNTSYQGIQFTETGAAKDNVNSRLKIKLLKVVDSITNKNMSRKQKLKVCWSYITGGKFRYASKYPNLNLTGWYRKTAYNMLSTYTGNCYSYACAFAALASEIGYNPYVICARIHGSRDRAADGYTRHAWVRISGKYYDPESHYAGWMKGVYAKSRYPMAHKNKKVVAYNKY